MVRYIDENKARFGVEPICRTLQVAPSTYYAAVGRPPSARAIADEELKAKILEVYQENYGVYGAEKLWRALRRKGIDIGRDRVARLMGDLGIAGVVRGRKPRTTKPGGVAQRPADLVKREFAAPAPNRLWVADLTYVPTWSGFVYVAFIVDVYSRLIAGWRVSTSLRSDLALDALEMAIWSRRSADLSALVHHSDRGVQYLSIRYTERLGEAGAVTSVGSRGDSYDNALAESVNGLFKTELIHRQGPWRSAVDVELATAAWVDWWNNRRLHGATGGVPPAEFEAQYYRQLEDTGRVA
jgi:putative transposase